jgi:hypothetical protein
MHPGVPQIMLGLACLFGGVLIIKVLGNEWGWVVFVLGAVLGCKGGIALSWSGAKELRN